MFPSSAFLGQPDSDVGFNHTAQLSGLPPQEWDKPSSPHGTPRFVLLQHFKNVFPDLNLFGSSDACPVISLGLLRPHLLDTVLAVSASHLRHHSPSPSYRVAEHFQQALAIRNFQTALAQPFDQQGSDALIITALLLNLLAFSVPGNDDPSNSWVFSQDADRLDWLALQMGFKPLLIATAEFREHSILQWMFNASDDENHTYQREDLPLTHVPESWICLFDLADSSSADSIFYEPVRILAELKRLPPTSDVFFLYLAFFGKLDLAFRSLLAANDERAVWLLGYWLGLLGRYDYWWMRCRVRRDYRAIEMWLEGRGVRDRVGEAGRMWSAVMDDFRDASKGRRKPT